VDDDFDPCGDAGIEFHREFGDDVGGVQQESGTDVHNERDDDIDTGYDDTNDNTAIDPYGGDDAGRSINVRDDLSNDGCRVCDTIELGDQWIALVLERVQSVEKVLRAIARLATSQAIHVVLGSISEATDRNVMTVDGLRTHKDSKRDKKEEKREETLGEHHGVAGRAAKTG